MSNSLPEKPADDVEPSSEGDAAGAASEAHRELSWDEFVGGAAAVTDDSQGALPPPVRCRPASRSPPDVPHGAPICSRHDLRTPPRVCARVATRCPRDRAGADSHDRGPAPRSALAEPPREKKRRKGAWGCLIVLVVLIALMAGWSFAAAGADQRS